MEIYPRPPPPPSHLLTLQVPPEWTEMHQMEYLLSVWRQRQAQREARGGTGVGGGRPHVGFFEALAEGVTPPPRGTPPPPFETFVPPAPPPIQTPLPVPRPAIQPGQRPQGPALVRIARILRLRPKPNRNVTQQQQPEDPPPADPQLARVHRALRAAKAKIRPRQTRPAPPSTPRPKARLPQHRPSGPPNRLGIRYLNLGTPPGPPPPLVGPLLLSIATQRNLTRGLQQGRRLPFRPPPGVPPPPIASLERAAAALRPLPKPVPKGKANPTHPVAKAKIQMMQRPETTHPVAVGPPPPPPAPKRAAKAKPLPPVAKAKIRQRIPPPEAKEAGLPPRGVLQIASPFNDQREPHVARRVYQLSRKEMTHQEIQRRGIIAMSSRFKRLRTGLPLAPAPPMKLNRGPHLTPSRHPRHPIPDQLTTRLGDWARSHAVLPNGLRVLLVISPSGAFALWVGKERSLGSNYPPWLMGLFDERLPLVKKLKTAKRLVYRTKMKRRVHPYADPQFVSTQPEMPFREVWRGRQKPSSGSQETCNVCWDDFAASDRVLMMPCGHFWHPPCIGSWLARKSSCPACRMAFPQARTNVNVKAAAIVDCMAFTLCGVHRFGGGIPLLFWTVTGHLPDSAFVDSHDAPSASPHAQKPWECRARLSRAEGNERLLNRLVGVLGLLRPLSDDAGLPPFLLEEGEGGVRPLCAHYLMK
uniref:RING-type domain-containing protein n=1 Tax=Chromera velia CCMP2878 TaxID=1169474 RepID=A0A0G4FU74_9ALVE|eukprot:Cvel_18819.t1-p1 / transcript=Cvel_18819.t1 / gene=Cvel_18819 / organism=Chromera_velia_CCMP2878 / gene_product=RING finger protein 126, putative / transcript_product=RING finger protein 126, putative / location=Cvel_scaffold1580:39759-43265(-) / protein_length=697 / sequence_SO=supercontig / SO=protein_coding / is_pseudo=false